MSSVTSAQRAWPQLVPLNEDLSEIPDEMQDHLSESARESHEDANRLSESKDRAQLTSTGALSLSLIVLLKNILDSGRDFPYFYISLCLIVISLCLQIIIGALHVYMHSLKTRHQRRDGVSARFGLMMQRQGPGVGYLETAFAERDQRLDGQDENEGAGHGHLKSGDTPQTRKSYTTQELFQEFRELDSSRKPWYMRWCPCCMKYERDIVQQYTLEGANARFFDILAIERLRADLEYREAKVRAKQYGSVSDQGQKGEIEKVLDRKWRTLNVICSQQKMISFMISLSERRRLNQQISSVQNVITYMFYMVFVLNAFITGFGLTGSGQNTESETLSPAGETGKTGS